MKGLVSIIVITSLITSACASSTVIKSIPPGAKVYVEGNFLGTAPVKQKDTALAGTSKMVVLKKQGYQEKSVIIRKEEIRPGMLIAGIFVLVPWLWIMGYPAEYTFELEQNGSTTAPQN